MDRETMAADQAAREMVADIQEQRRRADTLPCWHRQMTPDEPPCPMDGWRRRDRSQVVAIAGMHDSHLLHALALAQGQRRHLSRLPLLVVEAAMRGIILRGGGQSTGEAYPEAHTLAEPATSPPVLTPGAKRRRRRKPAAG